MKHDSLTYCVKFLLARNTIVNISTLYGIWPPARNIEFQGCVHTLWLERQCKNMYDVILWICKIFYCAKEFKLSADTSFCVYISTTVVEIISLTEMTFTAAKVWKWASIFMQMGTDMRKMSKTYISLINWDNLMKLLGIEQLLTMYKVHIDCQKVKV